METFEVLNVQGSFLKIWNALSLGVWKLQTPKTMLIQVLAAVLVLDSIKIQKMMRLCVKFLAKTYL